MSSQNQTYQTTDEADVMATVAAPGTLHGDLYALNVSYLNLMRRFAREQRDVCLIRFALTEEEVDMFAALEFEDISVMASPFVLQIGLRRELAPLSGRNAKTMRLFVASLTERRANKDRRAQNLPFVGEDRRKGPRRDEDLGAEQ